MQKGINTQTPHTKRLAAILRKTYRQVRSWSQTAKICQVRTRNGNPDKGLAYRIAHGYEPRTLELRQRLGLPLGECPECHRRIQEQKNFRKWKRLDDLDVDQVRWLLEHREVMA